MNSKRILVIAITIISAIFSLNSSFIESISPPSPFESKIAVGTAYLISIGLYLIFVNMGTQKQEPIISTKSLTCKYGAAYLIISLVFLFLYIYLLMNWTTDKCSGEREIVGAYSNSVQDIIEKFHSGKDPGCEEIYYGLPDRPKGYNIFDKDSLNNRKFILIFVYVLWVVGFVTTILVLTEFRIPKKSHVPPSKPVT